MNVVITKQDDHILASVEGRVDTITSKDFETVVNSLLKEENSNIILDCDKLSYVSSSGLRTFLIFQKGLNAKGGKLTLRSLSEPIKEIFEITGFASIFSIEN
ncbi:MAG: STAS domain-containing protein [Bacteroidales bacterium]